MDDRNYETWRMWSSQSSKYNHDYCEKLWFREFPKCGKYNLDLNKLIYKIIMVEKSKKTKINDQSGVQTFNNSHFVYNNNSLNCSSDDESRFLMEFFF